MSLGHIGRYELLQPLGRGGMAEVYLARPLGDPRSVVYALKSILPEFADDPRFVQMFHRELTIATGLCHPNLVSVLDHGREHGRHFMLLEYVHGPDLAKLLRTAGQQEVRPPLEAAVSIVLAVARGLHHLHEWPGKHGGSPGFVHRDVSPSNVLVGFDGSVKVTDFGVATATAHTRTTEAGGVKGKMGYLSPEQCRSEGLDRRSDIYALGVLLFESTLGERLFYGDNDYAVMHQIVSSDYERPTDRDPKYPPQLEAIILTALSENRDNRFSTAGEFADALESFAVQEGLDIGQETVASWVSSLVPWRAYPAFAPPVPAQPPVTAVPAPTAPSRPSRIPMLAAVAVPMMLGMLIAVLLMTTGGDEDVEDVDNVAAVPEPNPAPVVPPTAAPTPVPTVAPPAPVPVADPVAEPDLAPVIEVTAADLDAEPDDASEEPPPQAATKRRKKKRRRRTKKPRPGYDLDAPRPPQ